MGDLVGNQAAQSYLKHLLPQVKEGFTDWGHIGKLNGNRRILKFAKKIRQLLFVSERGSVSRCGIAGIIIKPLIE